jgi:hypothetical protein
MHGRNKSYLGWADPICADLEASTVDIAGQPYPWYPVAEDQDCRADLWAGAGIRLSQADTVMLTS